MLRQLTWLLFLEVIVGANAGASFHFLPRYAAAVWAGACFVALGLFILWKIFAWNFRSKSPLFWASVAHTFAFAIPLLAARLVTPPSESVDVVLFFAAERFHKGATAVYGIMMGATLLEMALEIIRMRKKTPKI